MLRALPTGLLLCLWLSCYCTEVKPRFTVAENGDFILSKDYLVLKASGGHKQRVAEAPNGTIAFSMAVEPVNAESFYFPGFYLHSDAGSVEEIRIHSSTGSVFSVVDYWWTSKNHLCVHEHLNPNVDELLILDGKSATVVKSFQGGLFTMIPGTDIPIYTGLRPPGAPAQIPESICVGDMQVGQLNPSEQIASNIYLSPRSNLWEIQFIIRDSEGTCVLGSLNINPDKPQAIAIQRGPLPPKKNKGYPVWFLRSDGKGGVISD